MNEIQHEYELSIVTVTFNAEKELKKQLHLYVLRILKKMQKFSI